MAKNINFDSSSGSSSFTYSTNSVCGFALTDVTFTPESTYNWLTITTGTTGTGQSTSGTVKFNVSKNSSASQRTASVTTKLNGTACTNSSFSITQQGVNCTCDDVHFTTTSLTLPALSQASGLPIIGYIDYSACVSITATSATTSEDWLYIGTLDKTNKRIEVIADSNGPVSARTASVTLYYDGPNCTSSITFSNITQERQPCNCLTGWGGATARTLDYQEATDMVIAKFEVQCTENLTFTSSTISSITYTYIGLDDNGYYKYELRGHIPANPSTANTVTHTVTPKFGTSACTNNAISITQKVSPCNCLTSNLTVTPTSTNIPYSGNPYGIDTYPLIFLGTLSTSCNGTIDFYSADIPFIALSGASGVGIYGYGISENPSFSDRTFSIDVYLNGELCTTFTVTQNGKPCLCSDFSFNEITTKNYFSITPLNGTYKMAQHPTQNAWNVKYSLDMGETWEYLPVINTSDPSSILNIPQYTTVMLKSSYRGTLDKAWATMSSDVSLKYSGNIMSMVWGDDFEGKTTFPSGHIGIQSAITDVGLVDAGELELPATTLPTSCYANMFSGCTNLIAAPKVLPATNPSASAYTNMFTNCRKLEKTPKIEALTLADSTCKEMFSGCIQLINIYCNATDISATDCTKDWTLAVSAPTGVFYKNASMTSWTIGTSGVPGGFTVNNIT